MHANSDDLVKDFTSTLLPVIEKPVCRMGIAGNYGLGPSDIVWAAEQGTNYWVWGASFKKVTGGIKGRVALGSGIRSTG